MLTRKSLRVRPLEVGDFAFVRELASKQPNFTIPPPYVLWLLLKIKGDICLVAEEGKGKPLAYLLAVPVEAPKNSLYVWQLASSRKAQGAVLALLKELHRITRGAKNKSVIFSALPNSASFRMVSRHLGKLLNTKPKITSLLPGIVAPNETEYRIDLL